MFCKYCGKELRDEDVFCSNCGKHRDPQFNRYSYEHRRINEPKEKLVYELAYSGFGFFVPLIMGEDKVKAKRVANQGLWSLIMAFIACTFIQGLGFINELFDGTLIFAISNATYSFAFIVFLCFMFYLAYRCFCNVKAIHNDVEVANILFFDQVKIIK